MKILNKTVWSTADLRRLIYRVAEDELDAGQLRHARVTIAYQRSNARILGWCHYGTARSPRVIMKLFLPRHGAVDTRQLAKVIAHEMGHAKGLRHREMNHLPRYGWVDGWKERYAWAQEYTVARDEPAPQSPDERLMRRRQAAHAKALQKAQEWARKARRAAALAKRWERRLAAAEKRLAGAQRAQAGLRQQTEPAGGAGE